MKWLTGVLERVSVEGDVIKFCVDGAVLVADKSRVVLVDHYYPVGTKCRYRLGDGGFIQIECLIRDTWGGTDWATILSNGAP